MAFKSKYTGAEVEEKLDSYINVIIPVSTELTKYNTIYLFKDNLIYNNSPHPDFSMLGDSCDWYLDDVDAQKMINGAQWRVQFVIYSPNGTSETQELVYNRLGKDSFHALENITSKTDYYAYGFVNLGLIETLLYASAENLTDNYIYFTPNRLNNTVSFPWDYSFISLNEESGKWKFGQAV